MRDGQRRRARGADPDEMVGPALLLASDAGSFVTGERGLRRRRPRHALNLAPTSPQSCTPRCSEQHQEVPVPVPARRIPRPPGADVDAVHGDERPQLLRPLVLERAGPHRRGVPRDRPRRVPEPRRDRRVRDHRDAGPPGGGAHVRRARRRPPGAGGRPLPHRGDRAACRSCASRATPRSRASPSTSRGTGRSPRTRSLGTRPEPGGRILLDAARFAQVGTWEGWMKVDDQEWEVSPDRWLGSRDRSWGIRPVGEQPGARSPRRDARRPQLLVALHAVPLRRLLPLRHRAGGRRRQPRHQRGDARVARRPHRAARVDGRRDRVPLRHPPPGTGGHAPPRREPQAVRRRVRDARVTSRSRSARATAATTGPTAAGWARAGSTA